MALLEDFVSAKTTVLTCDGRVFIGMLQGFDQATNVILTQCEEREFSKDDAPQTHYYGLYVIRGDNIAVIGEIDEDVDKQVDYETIRADPLKPVVH